MQNNLCSSRKLQQSLLIPGICVCAFVVLDLVTTMPRDWLGRTSPKRPILCQVGHKTLTSSVDYFVVVRSFRAGMHMLIYQVPNSQTILGQTYDIFYDNIL